MFSAQGEKVEMEHPVEAKGALSTKHGFPPACSGMRVILFAVLLPRSGELGGHSGGKDTGDSEGLS